MADKKNERCVLCLDKKRSPVSVQCGHSFCFKCLKVYKSYQKYAWATKCPICRSHLKEKKQAVKRKLAFTNANIESSITITTAYPSNTPTSSAAAVENQSEEVHFLQDLTAVNSIENTQNEVQILEEYMDLAANDSIEYTLDDSQHYNDDGNIEDVNEESYYDDYDDDIDEVDLYTEFDEDNFNILTTNIIAIELDNDSTISSEDNIASDIDSFIFTVDSNNNSSRVRQDMDSDVVIIEDVIIVD